MLCKASTWYVPRDNCQGWEEKVQSLFHSQDEDPLGRKTALWEHPGKVIKYSKLVPRVENVACVQTPLLSGKFGEGVGGGGLYTGWDNVFIMIILL